MSVSIVTISYNQAEFLERAILSVLEQNHEDIEYIVVDPGSTDGSREIIERYRDKIDQVVLEPDQGPANGLNKGFALASGNVFGFLNADDLLLPQAVSKAARFLANAPEISVVSAHSMIIDRYDHQIRRCFSEPFSAFRNAYQASILMQPSTFFRAKAFRAVGGFNVDNGVAWDGELFVDMALNGAEFALVDDFWSCYRLHVNSITSSRRLDQAAREYRLRIFRKIMGRDWCALDIPIFWSMRLYKHLSNPIALVERIRKGPIYGRAE
ncbi:MAG: glycosyltransferase [Betaproteobacteria bacterium]|nr:MAG: glycosyltransferase [Betaproteobacteria bacterium]